MNENLNLIEKLKNVPIGTEFYSTIFEEVKFEGFYTNGLEDERIKFMNRKGLPHAITKEGHLYKGYPNAECTIFPSKDQRDWSKFEYDPIAIGTPVMVRVAGMWLLRFYAGQGECSKRQEDFSEALIALEKFKGEEIIPVSEFDFEKLCRKQ